MPKRPTAPAGGAGNGGTHPAVLYLPAGHGAERTPRLRGLRLNNVAAVRRELVAVYKLARTGRIDPADATRLAYLLDKIARIDTDIEFERRLEALEAGDEKSRP